MLNSNSRVVTAFKDYLVYDDTIENLKDYYANPSQCLSSLVASPKGKSVIPNYAIIEESKYIFKNLKKKAKKREARVKPSGDDKKASIIFTKGLMDDLIKRTTNIPVRNINKLTIIDLVEKFIDRDSLSLINNTNCTNVKVPFTISIPVAKSKGPGPKRTQAKDKVVPLPNPLRKGVGRISPISRSKAKARHASQEYIKDPKPEALNKNNGRMTAIGYYPVRQGQLNKKASGEIKQGKVASAKLIKAKDEVKVEAGKAKKTIRIASTIALNSIKGSKIPKGAKESPKKGSECAKTQSRPKENIALKISTAKNTKPLQAQHGNSAAAKKLSCSRTNNYKKPPKNLPLVITPKGTNGAKVAFPVGGNEKKVAINLRAVSALGSDDKKG
eukprot:TRINITY_DN1646_c0_g1_i4.p1 TRINITY_DN1646_c0_g1~~TRINITY_DN1646_c0_g1_i4.p1  ORF type:complete len:386 (-),score=107.80 TRINITY_DN1646_c0_g1_i4:81-1238(-)